MFIIAIRYILLHDEELPRLSGLWPGVLDAWQRMKHTSDDTSNSSRDEDPVKMNYPSTVPSPDLVVIGGLQSMDRWPFPDQPGNFHDFNISSLIDYRSKCFGK